MKLPRKGSFFLLKKVTISNKFLISSQLLVFKMDKIKWFQRVMIVLLVSINVLFYCIKKDISGSQTILSTLTSMVISSGCILIYTQSRKRILAKISISKKLK